MAANYLGIEPETSVNDLLLEGNSVEPYQVRTALVRVADNLQVLACSKASIGRMAPHGEDIAKLINSTRQLADIVVVDVPCTYDDLYFTAGALATS